MTIDNSSPHSQGLEAHKKEQPEGEHRKQDRDMGISSRAYQMAKKLDRLGPGQYVLIITIPEIDAALWRGEIIPTKDSDRFTLPKGRD